MEDFSILSHNGTVTVESPSGDHRTFRIKTQPDDASFAPGKRILSLFIGPDNTRDYQGFAFVNGGVRIWRRFGAENEFIKNHKGLLYRSYVQVLLNVEHYEAMGMRFHAEAKCRRCNKKLSTPESITNGIGPVCAGR